MRWRALALLLLVPSAVSCGPTVGDLQVFVLTDLRPGAEGPGSEFDRVVVTLGPESAPLATATVVAVDVDFAASRPTRVAFFADVPSGDYRVRVALLSGSTERLARPTLVHVSHHYTLTLTLDRGCVDAYQACETAGQACVGRVCVDPACIGDLSGVACEGFVPECVADSTCDDVGVPCTLPRCDSGACRLAPNDAWCSAGDVCDVGAGGCVADPRACTPEALFEDRDGDGIGGVRVTRCPGPGFVRDGGDCDDLTSAVGRCDPTGDAGPDAGPTDGATLDGSTDGSRDGETDAATLSETCVATPSGPADEDLDGRVDEGCPFFVDTTSALLDFDVPFAVEPIGPGALELYLSVYEDRVPAIMRSTRATTSDRFSQPVAVTINDTPGWLNWMWTLPRAMTVPCEAYGQAQTMLTAPNYIYRFTRGTGTVCSESDPWGSPTRLFATEPYDGLTHPFLTADGLTLLVRGQPPGGADAVILASVRSVGGTFTTLTPLPMVVTSSGAFPAITDDLLDLFVQGATSFLSYHRDRADAAFGSSTTVSLPLRPVFVVGTQEVFGPLGSPVRGRYWRDRDHAPIVIPCPAGGLRSSDGLRCFWHETASPGPWNQGACGGAGTSREGPHLAGPTAGNAMTITSLLTPPPPLGPWVGLYVSGPGPVWVTGVPLRNSDLHSDVAGDGCYFYDAGLLRPQETADCLEVRASLCETELWPTWTPWAP